MLAAHGLLVLLLLLGLARQAPLTMPQHVQTVMVDVADHRHIVPVAAPPALKQVHAAKMTVMAPDFAIQTETKPPRADPAPAPVQPPAPVLETATSTNPDAMAAAPPSGGAPGTGAPSGGGTASGGDGGAGGYDISAYLARVAAHIQAHLHRMAIYQASDRPVVSDVKAVVHLVWSRDGMVLKAEIYKSSSFVVSDKEAVDAVWRAQPLPPIPPELRGESINGIIPVVFFDAQKH